MRIHDFRKFKDDPSYNSYASYSGYPDTWDSKYYKGNTALSRWLRKVDDNMKREYIRQSWDSGDKAKPDSGLGTIKGVNSLYPAIGRLIFGSAAAITDFLFSGKKKDSKSIKANKKEILDDWERENLGNKKVTDKDAEKFYTSGVLKGKGYFGEKYDPTSPKNDEEREYTNYLTGAMERYYKKIHQ